MTVHEVGEGAFLGFLDQREILSMLKSGKKTNKKETEQKER